MRELQPYEYEETFRVFRHEADYQGRLTPGGVLRCTQQVATDQCVQYGITDEVYLRTHTAYLLAKQTLHFYRTPMVDEALRFITQPEQLKRAVNKRLTVVLDEQGNEAALVDSRWVLVDTEKRTILRKHPPEVNGPWAECIDRELPMKMVKAKEGQSLGMRRAEYTLCDKNGHLNNTRYADMVCNAVPFEEFAGGSVQELMVFYHREVPMNEEFELFRAQTGEHQWYFCGEREGKCCFEASITFVPNAAQGE